MLVIFFPQIWKSSSLLYAVKTPYRQTLNKNLSNRFTSLQESYTTHGNTIIRHRHLVPEIKRFQSAFSHPQNINMSRVISVVYDPRLFLACVETSMNKYRRNSFPSQIAHNSFGTLPPFLHVLKRFWWREPKVLLQGLLKNFIPDIISYLLLIIDKNKIIRKNVSPTFTN